MLCYEPEMFFVAIATGFRKRECALVHPLAHCKIGGLCNTLLSLWLPFCRMTVESLCCLSTRRD